MAVTPPFNPVAAFANTAVLPFAPVARPTSGAGPSEALRDTSFAPLEQSEEIEGSTLSRNRTREGLQQRGEEDGNDQAADNSSQAGNDQSPDRAEQRQIQELKQRDREVRAHEQAHAAVGGRFAGAPSFSFTRGPDGVLYATGGEVSIDTGAVPGDPEATLRKAQVIRRAALAPVDPSPQDRRVAARASQLQLEAQRDIQAQQAEERREAQETRAQETEERRAAREAREAADEEDEGSNNGLNTRSFADRLIEIGVIEPIQPIRRGVFIDTNI